MTDIEMEDASSCNGQVEQTREIQFRVTADTQFGEQVAVTGDCKQLGKWKPKEVFFLTQTDELSNEWSGSVHLPFNVKLEYRYVICVKLQFPNETYIIIRKWETNFHARTLAPNNKMNETAEFGYYDGKREIQNGWCTLESVIQIKLFNNPMNFWSSKYQSKLISVKVSPMDLEHPAADTCDDESTDDNDIKEKTKWPIIEVAAMNEDEHTLQLQAPYGRIYNADDFVVYQAQMIRPETIAYMIDFFAYESKEQTEPPKHIGFSYVIPSTLHNSLGTVIAPITGLKRQPVGQLNIEYLVVHPLPGVECDMKITYSKYWNPVRQTLEIGHRGFGNSFLENKKNRPLRLMENSIASLKQAAQLGADYVEFDVQLTKDHIPVLFHDFYVLISSTKRYRSGESDLVEVPMKDLTLSQLQGLKIHHYKEKADLSDVVYRTKQFVDDDHNPFPTLKEALESIDIHVGFNVEIKWDMLLKDGSHEALNPFELNTYIDILMTVLLTNAGQRRIVISCFHPDICTMIRLKQNKYPVMFLTQGQCSRYPPYLDPRTSSCSMAMHFSHCAGILGIDVHTEDILNDPSIIARCREQGLVSFCWGDENNDPETVKRLKAMGINGIIHDSVDHEMTTRDNIFLIESGSVRREVLEGLVNEAPSMTEVLNSPQA